MKKNKILKKQVLLYTKELVLALDNYSTNKDNLVNLVNDISLTNELISVKNSLISMENAVKALYEFPLGMESVNFTIYDYINMRKYYEQLINETVKRKYNVKK